MLDADSFNNILEVVRVCVAANRADLIEPALIDRQHVGEVRATIAGTTAATTTAPSGPAQPAAVSGTNLFGAPTPAEAAALGVAIANRHRAVYGPRES